MLAAGARTVRARPPAPPPGIAALEAELGGRIGLMALDTGTGTRLAHRADERFSMASTFKWTLAAFVLARVDKGELDPDEPVRYGPADLLSYAPIAKAHLAEGALSVGALAAAAVEWSDNTAANLLLNLCGGPDALTRFLRSVGDQVTRLDRMELTLNSNLPRDPRDTTSPAAMVATMRTLLLGDVLSPASRARLIGWLKGCETGKERLRAGLPQDWTAGDKTGTGENGAINDLAIAWPPAPRAPVLIACYMSDSTLPTARLGAAHARIGKMVAAELA